MEFGLLHGGSAYSHWARSDSGGVLLTDFYQLPCRSAPNITVFVDIIGLAVAGDWCINRLSIC